MSETEDVKMFDLRIWTDEQAYPYECAPLEIIKEFIKSIQKYQIYIHEGDDGVTKVIPYHSIKSFEIRPTR